MEDCFEEVYFFILYDFLGDGNCYFLVICEFFKSVGIDCLEEIVREVIMEFLENYLYL